MTVIDADAHVVESERTWEYLEGADKQFTPVSVHVPLTNGRHSEFWAIDGRLVRKGPVDVDAMTRAIREMDDIEGRLAHMDQIHTDIQVLFPTIFLVPISRRPEIELALYRAYNRWVADAWRQSNGRLRWAVMAPTMSMEAAVEELRFGKENGACAVFMRGIEGDRRPHHPSFFPLYEAAATLDLAVCIHAATGSFTHHDLFPDDSGMWRFKMPGIAAFHLLLMNDIPRQFPDTRFGFVELSAQWVPYAVHDYARRMEKRGKAVDKRCVMHDNHLWVACQTDDDVAYVLTIAGEDRLVMGTDYGHADTSSEVEALQRLKDLPGVSAGAAAKILDANPRTLFSL